MDRHAPDALVGGYHELALALTLPDPNDRHVLAAAIREKADVIVTNGIRDFPPAVLGEYGLEAQTPDQLRSSPPRSVPKRSLQCRRRASVQHAESGPDSRGISGDPSISGPGRNGSHS